MAGFSLGANEIGQVAVMAAGGGGGSTSVSSNIYEIKYSPTSMFQQGSVDGTKNSLTSYQTYSYDELYNVCLVRKLLGGAGTNHYSAGHLIELWKNSTNYLDFRIQGYGVYLQNVKDGKTLSTASLIATQSDFNQIVNKSDQMYAEMNLHDKYVAIKEVISSQISTIVSCDFSDWDVSNLDEFNILTKINPYSSPVMSQHFRLNSVIDEQTYLDRQFEYGRYNAIPTTQHQNQLKFDSPVVKLGGTLTYNTDYKKIANVTQTSLGYYSLGTTAANATNLQGTVMILKFKVTSGSVTFSRGAGSDYIYFRNGTELAGNITGSTTFTPENDIEYTMFMKTTSSVGYTSLYGLRAVGTFTIEAWDPILTYEQGQNYCAETCNGTGFTGPIPMNSNSITLIEPSINYGTINKQIPIFTQKITTDGRIAIYTGSTWKFIS